MHGISNDQLAGDEKCRPDFWNLEGYKITVLLRNISKENCTEGIISDGVSGCPLFPTRREVSTFALMGKSQGWLLAIQL